MVLKNFLESKTNYILTTTHINNGKFENRDIKSGGWRWMDLFAYPYDFPADPLETIIDGGGDRYMCLWERRQILNLARALPAILRRSRRGSKSVRPIMNSTHVDLLVATSTVQNRVFEREKSIRGAVSRVFLIDLRYG